MEFASLSSLWLAVSLPLIVILYLLKRRYVDTPVSSHLLWRRVLREQEANRPWQRLRRQLLVWLQLLAAALLVLALTQPSVRTEGHARAHVLFVLDASASMQAAAESASAADRPEGERLPVPSRLERAKEAIIRYAQDEAGGSEYSLLLLRGQPELVMQRQAGIADLQAALDKAQPFYGHAAYRETLSLASALTRGDRTAEVRVYTDQQWPETMDGLRFDVPVQVERIGGAAEGNVSIVQFGVKASAASSAQTALPYTDVSGEGGTTVQEAVAVLKNWGTAPATFDAVVYADEHAEALQRVTLQPGEQQPVYWQRLRGAGVYRLELDVRDAYLADNTAFAFAAANVERKRAVYAGAGNLFLDKALALAGVDVLRAEKGADGIYGAPASGSPDLIVLDGVAPAEVAAAGWQRLLAATPIWEFPVAAPAADTSSGPADAPFEFNDHPVNRYLRLDGVHVAQLQPLGAKAAGWKPLISTGDGRPLVVAGAMAGQPRLEFAFALTQSDLPLRAEFPVLVQNAVTWLTAQAAGYLGQMLAGERLTLAVRPEAVSAQWVSASGAALPAEVIDGAVSPQQNAPTEPGLYRFVERDASGAELQQRWLAVRTDPREADVDARSAWPPAEPDGETGSRSGAAQGADSDGEQAAQQLLAASKNGVPLAPWIIAALLLVVLVEWEVYRRGHTI
ncbi:BatA domain-containing protein [Paenibacillus athensensis]|uniref:Aerotolerance regulator N-terminal domain-containing protein n=1 Tax=Paenibacillus athensensis TaxID=1967502 RepID=A0A4Y8PVH0_9BACL|nr:VWA domain-containing protein [Paenibacillus athensensis]MCD1261539.1 BatA domain-containing protein [Paenibacillus athensensis]